MGPPPVFSSTPALAASVLALLLLSQEITGASNGGRSSSGSQQQQTPADFDCPEEFGYYAHPTDCTLYYVCVFGGALLESCTGGLMYSHELQTCDWPRNVGCAPGQQQAISQPQQQHHTQKISQQPVSQQVDVPTRGRQRPQQIQIPKADLYTEEEDLGPAEELESDRQQRVYRGQPSTLGQVASDRDGITHSNAIPVPSSGGRDKLSVVSYGAQQQYNSKNERRQTNGLENSDHNFLTNTPRVRKRRDSSNSNRRSSGKKKKRGRRQRRQDRRLVDKKKNADNSKLNTGNSVNATERSGLIALNKDYNENEDDIPESEDHEGDHNIEYKDEEDNTSNEDYDDDDDEGEGGEEDQGEDDQEGEQDEEEESNDESVKHNKEEGSKENEASIENISGEFKFDDDKGSNSSADDFKIDFPDPPSSWDSFEEFKFPFDEMDFDFDKFLDDLKSDKFDDFVLYGTENPTSTTVYPTSIFNFGSSTFSPFIETSTTPSVKFDFYFPHFTANNKKIGKHYDETKTISEEDKQLLQNRADFPLTPNNQSSVATSIESPLPKSHHSGNMPFMNTDRSMNVEPGKNNEKPEFRETDRSMQVSPLEENLRNPQRNINVTPPQKYYIRRRPHPAKRIKEAQDRMSNVEAWNHRRNQFINVRPNHIVNRPHPTQQANNDTVNNHPQKNKWDSGQEYINDNSKWQHSNNRGTAKYTISTTPYRSGPSTPKYKPERRLTANSLPEYTVRTTEPAGVNQVTPKYNLQSTMPSLFNGNHEYRFTHSTHYDSDYDKPEQPRGVKFQHTVLTTDKPDSKFQNLSPRPQNENNNIKTHQNIHQKDRVVSYSYPSMSFHETRGPSHHENINNRNEQFNNKHQIRPNFPTTSNRNHRGYHHINSNQKRKNARNPAPGKQNVPSLNQYHQRVPLHRSRLPTTTPLQSNQQNSQQKTKQRHHPRQFGIGLVNNEHANEFHQNSQRNRNNSPQGAKPYNTKEIKLPNKNLSEQNTPPNHSSESYDDHSVEYNYPGSNEQSEINIQKEQADKNFVGPIESNTNTSRPNSTVFVNNRLHSFSYVHFHEPTNRTSLTSTHKHGSKSPLNYPELKPEWDGGFHPSITVNNPHDASTQDYVDDSKIQLNGTSTLPSSPSPLPPNSIPSTNPPAGSYVYFTSNIGSPAPVTVTQNNLYGKHEDDPDESYNDYYNEYDEGDYEDDKNKTIAAPKPPPVPKTLQNIDYQEYEDSEYEEYNDDEKDHESENYDENKKGHARKSDEKDLDDEEYYDDEEGEDEEYEDDGQIGEQSIEKPQATTHDNSASSTMTNMTCLPVGATPQLGLTTVPCSSESPTDRPTATTADEQKNTEQTRRTITLLRASVQPVQQQVYDTRGYNTTRYIQQQQYDPNYYAVYDEEAEQYKDIGDYSQYIQQKQQDAYARKKPSVEIIQQEQLRGTAYGKNKYSSQPENIYQSVTPQEYDSYSIQTNDDIPYRQVQTKPNNRFPEVKESVPTHGERRLITLSTNSDGTLQSNHQTNTDRSNGGARSEPVITEQSVVNITPRKEERTSSAKQTASRRSHTTSFAEEINALAPSGSGEDPVGKVRDVLSKSEEYLSDEASTERSSERSSERSTEDVSGLSKSLTVEEVDVDYLKKAKSQSSSSEDSVNRFRFTPRNQFLQTTQAPVEKYAIHFHQFQGTTTPSQTPSTEMRSRQAKVYNEEITTPKPLIFRLPEAFNTEGNSYERGQLRSRVESNSREHNRNYNSRQEPIRSRSRENSKIQSDSNESDRNMGNYYIRNQNQWQEHERTVGSINNDALIINNRNRGPSKSSVENRPMSDHRRQEQESPRMPFTTTPVPLRIAVAPVKEDNYDKLREQIIKQYSSRLEENRRQEALKNANRGFVQEGAEWSNEAINQGSLRTVQDYAQVTTEASTISQPKQMLIRIPESSDEIRHQGRQKVTPLGDFVNSNVNVMMENIGRDHSSDSSTEYNSREEQASEEARKPIAIRIPDTVVQNNQGSEERRKPVNKQISSYEEDNTRKPIRYMDSQEYQDKNSRFETARGASRFTPSGADDYENEDISNMTEEPRRPIRLPDRSDATTYRSRNQKIKSREYYNTEMTSRKPIQVTQPVPRPFEVEDKRRIVPSQTEGPTSTEVAKEIVRPIAIRVPDSIDLNQYQGREESPAAKIADSLTPVSRSRVRSEEENKQNHDQRTRIRVPFTTREDARTEQLRNRYEVATTLRPTRVLNFPTASKPTRPPKKFRNGTLYSDLTLPIGTDITDTNPSGPDTSTRVQPMSYNVPTTPGLTRGNSRHRGSLSYTVAPDEAEAPSQPRGTPPPQRGRPTLKPSTTVVGKAQDFIDIYRYPPTRPENVYPTPQVDKTAAKCRKDVCLLPDCYCGGKDVPGELTPEETPQIVLLTFDDSVNDLNKGLYSDLFEKGRVNPNGCPIGATFYVSHEWTDYSQVQNLYAGGHEIASHSVSHSFGEQFSQKKWTKEIAGQREILAAYGGVRLEDIRGMRAPFLAVGGNKMFKMLYDSNFTYDSSMPVYENRPPSWPYTLDYKIFHDCMIPPCPTKSYPGVWEVPMVMWQDLNGGRCSMGDACSNPPTSDGVYKMLLKNFERHFTTNRAPFGLFYHAAWFTQPHHKEGFISFLDTINKMPEVWVITNWQAIQWVRDPTPLSRLGNFAPFQCNYPERPKKCNNPKVCNLWHKSGVRYMRTCQVCPDIYPWTGKSGVRNSRIDNDLD